MESLREVQNSLLDVIINSKEELDENEKDKLLDCIKIIRDFIESKKAIDNRPLYFPS